jgi:hypothetical protein
MARNGWGGSAVLMAWMAAGATGAQAGESASATVVASFRVRINRTALATAVLAALEGASRRLSAPTCTAVFSEFTDGAGQTLQATLDALGQSGPNYLTFIGFYDGQGHGRCLRGRTLAITAPGSRAVWVCPQFALEQRRDPGLAEVTLIHEALHSLGLSEDPPSAAEITSRVVARCGR